MIGRYKPRLHYPPLDGLRGIAILMVIACHARIWDATNVFDRGVLILLNFGQHGVDLFFVLSGFLITGILLDSKGSPGYFQTFYVRRTLRIFPLYYLYLGLRLLLIPALANHLHVASSPLVASQAHSAFFWLYSSNLLGIFYPGTVVGGGLFHLWSLAVEEQFYLFWPLIVFLFPTRALSRLCLALVVLALVSRGYLCHIGSGDLASGLTFCRLDALAAGSLIAITVRREISQVRLRLLGQGLTVSSAMCIAVYMILRGWEMHGDWVTTFGVSLAVILSTGILLIVISGEPLTQRILSLAILRRVGKYSYSMYVFHFVVFRALAAPMAHLHLPDIAGSHVLQQLFAFLIVSSCTFLIGMASWYAFEMWFLRLKDRFRYQVAVRQADAASRTMTSSLNDRPRGLEAD
jgi:peptidoglycan/LPS O-acetylase OafA/YrhL